MRSPRGDAGRGVAPRRARHPVVEIARGQRDVARRAGRAARRVDPDDLVRRSAQRCAPIGFSGVRRRAELVLLGERQLARCPRGRPPPAAEREAGRRQLLAVEGRALEEVARAARGSSRRRSRAARPRARLDLGRRASALAVPGSPLVGDRLLRLARHQEADRRAPAPRRGGRAGRRCARAAGSP